MHCQKRIIALQLALLLILLAWTAATGSLSAAHSRVRRKVVFAKNSKIFFRLNGKNNVVPWVQVFAYGYVVRVNWDLPDTLHRRHKFFKRDLHAELERIRFDRSENYQTYSCLLTFVCEQVHRMTATTTTTTNGNCGMFCSIGKIISQSNGIESTFFQSLAYNCNQYRDACST